MNIESETFYSHKTKQQVTEVSISGDVEVVARIRRKILESAEAGGDERARLLKRLFGDDSESIR
jgi:hypothetical protein